MNINLDSLASEITKYVTEYTEDVSKAIDEVIDETANDILAEVKATAPVRESGSRGYAKNFKVSKDDRKGKTRRVVWNRKNFSIAHLLEFGHALKNGGRARAFPHLRKAYDNHIDAMQDKIKDVIRRGGK